MYINKETGVGKEEKENVEFAHKKVSWTNTMVLPDKCINMYVCLKQYVPNSLLKRYIYKWMSRCGRRLGWVRTLRTQTLLVVSSFSKELELFKIFRITRSYAALWAADLDWIVGPGYSLGRVHSGEKP